MPIRKFNITSLLLKGSSCSLFGSPSMPETCNTPAESNYSKHIKVHSFVHIAAPVIDIFVLKRKLSVNVYSLLGTLPYSIQTYTHARQDKEACAGSSNLIFRALYVHTLLSLHVGRIKLKHEKKLLTSSSSI